jgi:cell division protease FtsH
VQILNVHLKKAKLGSNIEPEQIAALTAGFSGADLANLVNEAALLATRRDAQAVTMEDFIAAIERIVAGLEKRNRLLNPLERKVVAFHESGHALVALSLPGSDTVQKISIIPRGIGSLGYTIQRPTEDRYLMTRRELENRMAVLLAGRAAETIVFKEVSTGAADDLAKATDIARSIATKFGMSEKLGQVALEESPHNFLGTPQPTLMIERKYSEQTAREIDCEVREILERALKAAIEILTAKRALLDKMAGLLLEKETLTESEIKALLAQG